MKEPNIHDELKNIAPELSKMKATEGYSIPPVYFKELQDKVLTQIYDEQHKETAGSWLQDLMRQYFKPRYAFAMATIAILIVAAIVFRNSGDDPTLLSSISTEDAYEYVHSHIDEFETMDLFTLAEEEHVEYSFRDFSDEEINIAVDALLEDIDGASLEELF